MYQMAEMAVAPERLRGNRSANGTAALHGSARERRYPERNLFQWKGKKIFQEDTADLADRHMGCYCETSGRVEAIDSVGQMIRINGQVIPFADIQDIAGSMILGE